MQQMRDQNAVSTQRPHNSEHLVKAHGFERLCM